MELAHRCSFSARKPHSDSQDSQELVLKFLQGLGKGGGEEGRRKEEREGRWEGEREGRGKGGGRNKDVPESRML